MSEKPRKCELRDQMLQARRRTLELLDLVPDDLLKLRVHDFYSPIGWHFGHIAMTEEFWTQTQALHRRQMNPEYSFLFANLPENPKDQRVNLPGRAQIVSYMALIEEQTLATLDETDLDADHPLISGGYAWDFALQHEYQHQETICELLQLLCQQRASLQVLTESELEFGLEPVPVSEMVEIPGGSFVMGSDDPFGYDNEKRAHRVEVAPFRLDRMPVSAAQWVEFIQDGGYQRRELWSEEGWAWRLKESAEAPEYWFFCGGGYGYYDRQGVRPIHPLEPAGSISWYEADAYARWVGKRLPTETEWEFAAAFDPATGRSRRYPWGDWIEEVRGHYERSGALSRAVGSRQPVCTALGLQDMAGGVWEWTSTPFLPYPGFVAFPYDGYSKDHFDGTHYVCRGGSHATSPRILRCSFRNWYVPTYRQGFLGLRCASS